MESRLRDWARTAASALRDPARAKSLVRDTVFRAERKYAKRYSDVQLRQLKSLENAYARPDGPDLLVFGDSAMYWTTPVDEDHRHMVEMIRDEIGPETTFEALVGPLYNARIVMAFLAALEHSRSRPKVIIVPTSVWMSQSCWLADPERGYESISAELRQHIAAGRKGRPRRLTQPVTEESILAWERQPAPSLFGARRTVGELRLITDSRPATRWQGVVRLRHMMDHYYAERLEPESLGTQLVAELGRTLRDLGVPAVAYISPNNHEVIKSALGEKAVAHVVSNAELLERTFLENCGPLGVVVNANLDSPASEFVDPVHLGPAGRLRLARRVAAASIPHVRGDAPAAAGEPAAASR